MPAEKGPAADHTPRRGTRSVSGQKTYFTPSPKAKWLKGMDWLS